MSHYAELTPAEEQMEFEVRSVGMSIDEARAHIVNSKSYELESPQLYILGQLALVQEYFQTSRGREAQQCMNRLRMALVENFTVSKVQNPQ
jgi:hypothetical protein